MSDEHETPPYSNDADLPLDDPETLSEEDIVSEDGPEAELDALKAENAELKDRFLRLAAELDNTRRRADREKADASRYAIANFARDLIGVADNFGPIPTAPARLVLFPLRLRVALVVGLATVSFPGPALGAR